MVSLKLLFCGMPPVVNITLTFSCKVNKSVAFVIVFSRIGRGAMISRLPYKSFFSEQALRDDFPIFSLICSYL